ncbi:MAG: alpha/beta hydrolase [Gammaproteobacteria bacterium]|nr:MAG: alpha/beta hydrolase [Gammaproteobacteria bacterium]
MPTKNINGFECRYEVSGNLDAEDTVIFINGIANSLESWTLIKKPIESNFRILTYDLRGQWFSEVTDDEPYSFKGMAEDLYALMQAMNIDAAHFVGTSLGGEIAFWFALMYPEKAKSICSIAAVSEVTALLQTQVNRWRSIALEAVNEINQILELLECEDEKKEILKKWGHNFYQGVVPELYANSFLEANYEVVEQRDKVFQDMCHPDFFRGQVYLSDMFFRLRTDEKFTHRLKEIDCPTLLIAGEKDVIKPPSFSELMVRNIPGSQMRVLKDAGHALINERPQELGKMVKDFLLQTDSESAEMRMEAS